MDSRGPGGSGPPPPPWPHALGEKLDGATGDGGSSVSMGAAAGTLVLYTAADGMGPRVEGRDDVDDAFASDDNDDEPIGALPIGASCASGANSALSAPPAPRAPSV